eukprot:GILK01011328.1.p1 GENE.GILK01011328.1~~GILK01011328.1.p1  ORF type:complete len:394 (+),score=62.23 GILK01011328.1:265-1446(+)
MVLLLLAARVNRTSILATSSEIANADPHKVAHKATSNGFVLLLVVNGSVQLSCYQVADFDVSIRWQRTVLPYVVTPAFHDVGPIFVDSFSSLIVLVVPYQASLSSILTSFLGINVTSFPSSPAALLHVLLVYSSSGQRLFALPLPATHCASPPRVTAVSSFGRRRRLSVAAVGSCRISDQVHEHAWIYFASIRRNRENVMNLTHDLVLVLGLDKITELSSRINSLSFFDAVRLLVVGTTGFETNETGSTVAVGDAMIATIDLSIGQVLHFERFPPNSFNGLFDLIPASTGSAPDYEFLTLGSWKRFRDDLVFESVSAIFRLTLRLSDRVPWWQSFPAFIAATVGGLLLFTVVSWCLIRKKRGLAAVSNCGATVEDMLSPLLPLQLTDEPSPAL